MPFGATLGQPDPAAAAIIRGKPAFARAAFDQLLPELKARAITVSGLENLRVIERIRDELATIPETTDWTAAKQAIATLLEPDLGDAAEQRAETLLRTHAFQAFQAGIHETGMADEDTTHWQYLATEDDKVRDSHLALNGIILRKDDPFWQTHFPPWDWGCRCRVRPINADLLQQEREADAKRPPEGRNVLEGAVAQRARDGQVIRAIPEDIDRPNGPQKLARPFDISPDGGRNAFRGTPGNLRIPLQTLRVRYQGEEWTTFERWAKSTQVSPGKTVWQWVASQGD